MLECGEITRDCGAQQQTVKMEEGGEYIYRNVTVTCRNLDELGPVLSPT